jgi:hypothetical protein
MSAAQDLAPLDYRVPIVDSAGRPSPQFQRAWNTQRANNGLISPTTIGNGNPPAEPAPSDGEEFVNIATTPATLFVGSGGLWKQAGAVTFLQLEDAPNAYTGAGGNLVQVNSGATGLQFSTASVVLDGITNVQGSVLFRGAAGWQGLGPGATPGLVLQTGGPGANPSWVAQSGGGGGGGGWTFSASSLTAASGQQIIATGAAGQTITLPASPSTGAFVAVRVELLGAFSNRVTVSGDGKLITGTLFTNQSSIRLGLDGQEVWFIFDGTVWRANSPDGPTLLCPKVADFTFINQGTATATDTATGLAMSDPNSGQPSQRILSKPVAGTFTQLTCLVEKSGTQGNFTNNGPVILDSSGKYVIIFEQLADNWFVGFFNSPTSNRSFPVNGASKLGTAPWFKYVLSGASLQFCYSSNPGNFNIGFTDSVTAFLSSLSSVGLAVDGGAAGSVVTTFRHFHQE